MNTQEFYPAWPTHAEKYVVLTRSAFNTILFVCFLLLFTSLALSEPRNKMRAFEGFLRKRFDEASPVRLEEVQSVDDFWRYFNEPWEHHALIKIFVGI